MKMYSDKWEKHIQEKRKSDFIKAVNSTNYSHCRASYFKGKAHTCRVYIKDTTSPSGITLAGSWNFAEAVMILDLSSRPFPLSPSERP
jgi:hypothetical protein